MIQKLAGMTWGCTAETLIYLFVFEFVLEEKIATQDMIALLLSRFVYKRSDIRQKPLKCKGNASPVFLLTKQLMSERLCGAYIGSSMLTKKFLTKNASHFLSDIISLHVILTIGIVLEIELTGLKFI